MKCALPALCFAMLFCSSCEVKVNTGDDDKTKPAASTGSNSKIRNNIDVKSSGGLKVEQAFLLFEDGSLVPADNKIKVNQKVNLRLIIKGFKEENGKVYFGASEKITTNEGGVIVDVPDLFIDYEKDGVTPEQASYITLMATITEVDKLFDYFLVSFRVWDKKANGEITGSYKLYL